MYDVKSLDCRNKTYMSAGINIVKFTFVFECKCFKQELL